MLRGSDRRWAIALTVAALLVLVFYGRVLPAWDGSAQALVGAWIPLSALNEGVVLAISALGLHLAVHAGGRLDLGFVAYWALGGYAAGWLMSAFFQQVEVRFLTSAFSWQRGIHLSFWIVLMVGGLLCALLATTLMRATAGAPGQVFAVLALAVGVAVPQVLVNLGDVWGLNLTNGMRGIAPIDPIGLAGGRLGPFDLTWRFGVYGFVLALVIAVVVRLRQHPVPGKWGYVIAAFVGGVGGVTFATHSFGVLPLRFDLSVSIMLLTMVVLGAHLWGIVIAAVGLTWINAIAIPRIADALTEATAVRMDIWSVQMLLFGVLLVVLRHRSRDTNPAK